MPTRPVAILLLIFVSIQFLFGGLTDAVVLCLGGGHGHAPTALVQPCGHECAHDVALPAALTQAADHEDNCGCLDITLSLAEFVGVSRPDAGKAPVPDAARGIAEAAAPWFTVCEMPTGPPAPPWFDPGLGQRLSVVASTRLLL